MKINNSKTCDLFFSNLSTKTNKGKEILRNIHGQFPAGSLIAIMGPSGAGKTTLLNVLSGYNVQRTTCDSFKINDTCANFEDMSKISCYITQDIYINGLLTVKENMLFAADFKLGIAYSQAEKNTIITDLLDSFGLSKLVATRASKLSGGEQKKLAIALEMISDPNIICLDEPTTGLDISTTKQTLNFLRKIADSGKTVICTIHQVSASHFDLFDHAYVIADGRCAYQGRPKDLVPFLDKYGLPCNIYHNPADYLIELCSGDYGTDKADYLIDVSQNENASILEDPEKNHSTLNIEEYACSNSSWLKQYKTLVHREYIKLSRNVFLLPMRIIGSNIVGLFFGLLFLNVGNDASKVVLNYNFGLGAICTVLFAGLLCPVIAFPSQMQLVKREIFNKYYSVFQYYSTVLSLDWPIAIFTISSSTMVLWILGGQPMELERILVYQLFMITLGCVVHGIGFFFGTMDISLNAAILGSTVSQLPLLVISGFGLYFQDMYWMFEYAGRAIYLRNGFEGLLVAMMGLSPRKMECASICMFEEPHKFLLHLGIDPYHYMTYWYVLIGWLSIIIVMTYANMKYRFSR